MGVKHGSIQLKKPPRHCPPPSLRLAVDGRQSIQARPGNGVVSTVCLEEKKWLVGQDCWLFR